MSSADPQTSSRRTVRLVLALASVAAAAWLAYSPGLGAWFRHDDFWWLSTAQRWANGTQRLADAPAGVAPVYNVLYYWTFQHWGLEARPYFVELLLCHVVNALLAFALIRRLTGRTLAAWLGGLFFALHYVHHEAIVWPAGGCHAFALTFILLAVLCWLRFRAGERWGLPASVLLAGVALLTKDSGIAFLPILLAIELTVHRRAPKRVLLWHSLPLLALIAWRVLLPPALDPKPIGSADFRPGLHQLVNVVLCVPQMLLPDLRFENYAALLGRLLPPAAVSAASVAALVGMVVLTGFALYGLRRGSALTRLGLLWCYLGFAPYTLFSYYYARAPRYLYIPSVGLALLVGLLGAFVAERWSGMSRAARALVLALALGYGVASFGFARIVCSNRLRDSKSRRAVVAAVLERVPRATSDTVIRLVGLPSQLADLTWALNVTYQQPIRVMLGDGPRVPGTDVFRFAMDGLPRLRSYERVPGTAPDVIPGAERILPSSRP